MLVSYEDVKHLRMVKKKIKKNQKNEKTIKFWRTKLQYFTLCLFREKEARDRLGRKK